MENYQSLELTYIHKTLKDISNRDGSEFIPLVECCSSFQKINGSIKYFVIYLHLSNHLIYFVPLI